MPRPIQNPNYKPSPQKPTIYDGPAVPVSYNSDWQHFTNLTGDQIAWFQAQPEWQNFLAYVALSPATAAVGPPVAIVNSALQTVGKPLVTKPKPIISL